MSTKSRKLSAVLSYRVATLRALFSLLKQRSTRLGNRLRDRSTPTRILRDFRMGITWWSIATFDSCPDMIRIIAPVGEQDARGGQVVGHHQIEAAIIGRLARRDFGSHGQAMRVGEEVDLGRETTTRTAEPLSRSHPFEPAARW